MKEMARMLLEYGVSSKEIATLKRWDRVYMIREFSSKAASDKAGDGMERFSRDEKIKLVDKIDSYKKRIQEIWDRQRLFLQEKEEDITSDKPETLVKEDVGLSADEDGADDDEDDEENDEFM